ncbi:unnamed protein product [Darwinula stevensoni]|uniref:Amidase domain-containing protein n=1 Tax=Darwinula stevensoni TaxID=69355 RepID=A0A7R8XD69_9CRUS|nr:unnamed protein product [Darwinula stevensoni]CAG0893200.1 unnamed protein product [Darwinula stevensoni]
MMQLRRLTTRTKDCLIRPEHVLAKRWIFVFPSNLCELHAPFEVVFRKFSNEAWNGRLRLEILEKFEIADIQKKIHEEQERRQKQLKELEDELTEDGSLLTPERKRITSLSTDELLSDIQSGKLSATTVLKAFQAAALESNKKLNCVTEFIVEAKTWAKECDEALEEKRKANPLHGLPFSIKENFMIKGHDVTYGIAKHLGTPSDTTSYLVQAMRNLGAIPFCRTNVPQTMIRIAWTVVAVIDRSIFCMTVVAVGGFLSRDVHTLEIVLKDFLGPAQYSLDPLMPSMPFNHEEYQKKKLKIGYYDEDGFFPATPGCKRAVSVARKALEAAGHEMISFTPPNVALACSMLSKFIQADGGSNFIRELDGEVVDQSLDLLYKIARMPGIMKKMMHSLVGWSSPKTAIHLEGPYLLSRDLWQGAKEKDDYVRLVVQEWKAEGLDACILPAFPTPAQPHSYPSQLLSATSYTAIFNLLDFPVGVVPVTKEMEADQEALKDYPTTDSVYRLVLEAMKGALGCPIGVQVAALPWKDEVALRVMSDIETHLSPTK